MRNSLVLKGLYLIAPFVLLPSNSMMHFPELLPVRQNLRKHCFPKYIIYIGTISAYIYYGTARNNKPVREKQEDLKLIKC